MANGSLWHNRVLLAKAGAARHYSAALVPGLCFCFVVVLASSYISDRYGTPQILGALLLGMAFNSVSKYQEFSAGINFCAKKVLRIGVALLGARISFAQVYELGYKPVLVVAVVVVATFTFGSLAARLLKVDFLKGVISSAAVAICGASAALAVAAVLQGKGKHNGPDAEKHLLCTLVGVTGLSTIVMIVYPGLMVELGLSTEQIGMFLGASIHDVAQVLGAGHMISDEVAELATYTKMLRVTMLVPVIMLIACVVRAPEATSRNPLAAFPVFLIGFVVLMVLANVRLIPAAMVESTGDISKLCLLLAMVALGTKTNLIEMWQVGIKPFLLLFCNTLFIAGLALLLIV